MSRIGLWTISASGPSKVTASEVDLERQLEDWIEKDPSLINPDLVIVGRQTDLGSGPVDLIALDQQGRWVLIEIKRGELHREAVGQVLEYAGRLRKTPFADLAAKANEYFHSKGEKARFESIFKERTGESDDKGKREVVLCLVGTGCDSSLEEIIDLLNSRNTWSQVILFEIFNLGKGERVLVREIKEAELGSRPPIKIIEARPTLEEIISKAKMPGLNEAFHKLMDVANKNGIYPRPYKRSIMFAPGQNKSRCLFVAGFGRSPHIYVYIPGFSEFYREAKDSVRKFLGNKSFKFPMTVKDIEGFAKKLNRIFPKNAKE